MTRRVGMTPDEPLRVSIERAAALASRLFERDGEIYRPIWHALRADGTQFILPAEAPDKDTQMILIRALFDVENVIRYTQIMEAWFGAGEEAEMRELAKTGISGRPDRREYLNISGQDHKAGFMIASREILRTEGKPRLGPLVVFDFEGPLEAEGRMMGLLPARGIAS